MSSARMNKSKRIESLSPLSRIVLVLLPLAAALVALCIGRMSLPPMEVLRAIAVKLGAELTLGRQTEQVVWMMRMPRILLAMLVGGGLSVAGCAFQSLFANPLATPDTLGVASGASFGAALALLLGWHLLGVQAAKTGHADMEDLIEITRMFSSEIEYSDENIDAILDWLAEGDFTAE